MNRSVVEDWYLNRPVLCLCHWAGVVVTQVNFEWKEEDLMGQRLERRNFKGSLYLQYPSPHLHRLWWFLFEKSCRHSNRYLHLQTTSLVNKKKGGEETKSLRTCAYEKVAYCNPRTGLSIWNIELKQKIGLMFLICQLKKRVKCLCKEFKG